MIDEISRSIRAHLYERVTNPLLGAVTISWVAWNYKLLLTLFSPLSLSEKIKFIEGVLYHEWYIAGLFLIVLPLSSGILFLYLYPIPARHVYRYTRSQLKELKKIKLEVEDETPASQQEHIQLKLKVSELEGRYYSDIVDRDAEISKLKQMLSDRSDLQPAVRPSAIRRSNNPAGEKEVERKRELQEFADSGKIAHKRIIGLTIDDNRYDLGREIKSDTPGDVSVFKLSQGYGFDERFQVKVHLDEPLEPNQTIWVFDGYSAREVQSVEFEIHKADFEKKSVRIEVHQPNPVKPGKHVVVSNIVQFQY